MAVTTTNSRVSYTGDGATTLFAYPFQIFAQGDIQVYVAGVLKTLTTDYTISGTGVQTGGNVSFIVAPAAAAAILFIRVITADQQSQLPGNDKFPSTTVEKAMDKLTLLVQQLQEVDNRTLKLAVTSTFNSIGVPDPVAGKILRWNTGATALENVDLVGTGVIAVPVSVLQGGTGVASTGTAGNKTSIRAISDSAKQLTQQALTHASTVLVDASLGDEFTLTATSTPFTLGNPSNPTDGQRIIFRIKQDGTGSRVMTLDTKYRLGTDITAVVLTTTAGKTDYIGCLYNLADDKWDVIAFVKGY